MEPTDVVYELARHYVDDFAVELGSGLTARIKGHLRSRSISSLCEVSNLFDPVLHGWIVLKVLLQVEALFKKCDLFSDEKCESAAEASFLESEEICKATNKRLDCFYDMDYQQWESVIVRRMESIIDSVLGPRKAFIEGLPSLIRVTNGATATQPRRLSGGAVRLRRSMYATERSHAYLRALAKFWGYKINFRKIHHNRVELVPKNWRTHRTIACEPEGNIALQLAFDTFCKRKLKSRLNIDLSDQSRNQRLALESSVHGKLCTVDLKAASDRLALNVVHLLFNREWVDFFLDTRSPCWRDKHGVLRPYAKLSSMGNGYTFTIETLVFGALCKALGSREAAVYGDDIIIETELYDNLVRMLSYLGFEVNKEKSHVKRPEEGGSRCRGPLHLSQERQVPNPFAEQVLRLDEVPSPLGDDENGTSANANPHRRDALVWLSNVTSRLPAAGAPMDSGVIRESCGVHAYGGRLVTPLYVRSLRTKRDWALLVNNITAFGKPGGTLWQFATEIVREHNLPLGPPVLDTCAHVFIDVHTCYRLGLIRMTKAFGPWQPACRSLVERSRHRIVRDSRALFLWYLHRKERPYESTRHTLGTFKVRSKWVRYRPVMADIVGGSVHLHWWTELLVGREAH